MKYDFHTVIQQLRKKSDILAIDMANKTITINRKPTTLGNGSWGKLDYLTNHNGFVLIYN